MTNRLDAGTPIIRAARRVPALAALLLATSLLAACHSAKGGAMPYTGGPQTYQSIESRPVSVSLIDTRTGEELFAMDVPVGKQLVIDFDRGGGDDPVKSPDMMKYDIEDIGRQIGRLRNSMSVPNAYSRRFDYYLRKAPEFAQPPAEAAYRIDKEKARPDWWTAKGGEMPEKDGTTTYDD